MPAELSYADKLKDPRWQKIRLQVFERDEWCCQHCYDSENTLHCHHFYYESGKEPWEYPLTAFETLCQTCHESETKKRSEAEQSLLHFLKKAGLSSFFVSELAEIFSEFPQRSSLEDVLVTALRLSLLDSSLKNSLEKLTYIGNEFREQSIQDISSLVQHYLERKLSEPPPTTTD